MRKNILESTSTENQAGKPWVRRYWPVVPLLGMGVVTLIALSSHSTRADGGIWTLPYFGTYSSSGTVVSVNNTGAGNALVGETDNGTGVVGVSVAGSGVYGTTTNGYGVLGSSTNNVGVLGNSNYVGVLGNTNGNGFAIVGQGNTKGVGVLGDTSAAGRAGVEGYNTGVGTGTMGDTTAGVYGSGPTGVYASGETGMVAQGGGAGIAASGATGIYATGIRTALYASCPPVGSYPGQGVYAEATSIGVYGVSKGVHLGPQEARYGVYGESSETGATSSQQYGVRGNSTVPNGTGVFGYTTGRGTTGVIGEGATGVSGGGDGTSGSYGVYGTNSTANGVYAGYFSGNVQVTGTLTAAAKNFKIDHPLDPANKYLVHSCVESSEMLNTYSGNVTLDSDGNATVQMPEWFQAENGDFRYQLTCVGGFAPVYVDKKMDHNQFAIAGGKAGMEVSWQVTGVRQDAYAKAHPMQVEEDKTGREKGKYLNPKDLGKSETLGIDYETRQRLMQRKHSLPKMPVSTPPRIAMHPHISVTLPQLPASLRLPTAPAGKP